MSYPQEVGKEDKIKEYLKIKNIKLTMYLTVCLEHIFNTVKKMKGKRLTKQIPSHSKTPPEKGIHWKEWC